MRRNGISTDDVGGLWVEPGCDGDDHVGDHEHDTFEPVRATVLDEVVDQDDGDEEDTDEEAVR